MPAGLNSERGAGSTTQGGAAGGAAFSEYLGYVLPTLAGMLALSTAELVDGVFLANYVGAHALAALNITIPAMGLIFGVSLMISVGGSSACGHSLGAGETELANAQFTRSLISILIFSFPCVLAGFLFVLPLVELLGAAQGIEAMSAIYLRILLLGSPVIMAVIVLYYFVRMDRQPRLAALALLLAALGNVVLDWWFIARLEWGMAGAAWATILAHAIAALVLILHFLGSRSRLRLSLVKGTWRRFIRSIGNGFSEFVDESSVAFTVWVFNLVMMQRHGVDGVAAFTVINYLLFIGLMFCYSVSDSILPLCSEAFGAGRRDRVVAFLRYAAGTVLLSGVACILVLLLASETLLGVFLDAATDADSFAISLDFIGLFWPVFLFNGLNIVTAVYLTALQQPLASASLALLRSLLLPVCGLLILPRYLGDEGVYLVFPVAEVLAFFLALALFRRFSPLRMIPDRGEAVA